VLKGNFVSKVGQQAKFYSASVLTIGSWASMKALMVLLAVSASAFAAPPEQAERFTQIAGFNLANLPTFEALAHVFGSSPVVESGDASEYDARVCYRSQDGSRVVEFFHGEVHWGFTLRTPTKTPHKCSASRALTAEVTNVAGVTLGMMKKDYVAAVGHPTKATTQRIEHEFQYVHVLTDKELSDLTDRMRKNGYEDINPEDSRRWDVLITLKGTFRNERLDSFTVTRVETN
jgi:hypothetical protein